MDELNSANMMQISGSEKQKQENAVKLLQEQMHELFHQLSAKKRQLQQMHSESAKQKVEHAAELAYDPLLEPCLPLAYAVFRLGVAAAGHILGDAVCSVSQPTYLLRAFLESACMAIRIETYLLTKHLRRYLAQWENGQCLHRHSLQDWML
jgi:hypothetical protein